MNELEPSYECPEYEQFLSDDEVQRGHRVYFKRRDCIKNYIWGKCEGSCGQEFLDNSEYYLLQEFATGHGFNEYTVEETKNSNGEITTVKKTVQGFYVDDRKTLAIISDVANPELIPEPVKNVIQSLIPITAIYEGYEYLLVKSADKISTFNIQFYRKIIELIREVDLYVTSRVNNISINESGTILVLNTGQTKYLIAAIADDETVEIERSLLTTKLDNARPFFEFKPIRKVDWEKLKADKGDNFEKLVETLLQLETNISNVTPIGKTNAADRGRDFIVTEKAMDTFGKIIEKKWLVQCKYSDKSISTKAIPDWVTRTVEHGVNGYWLMTNNDITPDLIDQLFDVPKNESYKIETRFWQRNTFDIKLATRPETFRSGLFFD
jgi:hypothetical protein